MTEAELDEIPARHFPRELYPEMCNGCHESWPCEQSRLASEVERLRRENGRLRAAIQTVLDDNETGAGGWGPDVTMAAVLRAALEGGE